MKRKMRFSLMLTLSLLLSLVSLPATAQAAPPQRFRAETGVVTPGLGQTMFITISPASLPSGLIKARIRWMSYGAQGCSGMPPVCRHMVVSQGATPVETLGEGDALSFDVQGTGDGVQLVVESDSRNLRVNAMIINSATGEIVAFWTLGIQDNQVPGLAST
jgi:hypothetical protein